MTKSLNHLFFTALMGFSSIVFVLMLILLISPTDQPIENGTLIGMAVFALISLVGVWISWRYLVQHSKQSAEYNEQKAKKAQELEQIKKERFERISLTEKDRELRANQKSDDVLINKALKTIRIGFCFVIVIVGVFFYAMIRLLPDEIYWLKVWFVVLYVFLLAIMLWIYRWRARTYREKR